MIPHPSTLSPPRQREWPLPLSTPSLMTPPPFGPLFFCFACAPAPPARCGWASTFPPRAGTVVAAAAAASRSWKGTLPLFAAFSRLRLRTGPSSSISEGSISGGRSTSCGSSPSVLGTDVIGAGVSVGGMGMDRRVEQIRHVTRDLWKCVLSATSKTRTSASYSNQGESSQRCETRFEM